MADQSHEDQVVNIIKEEVEVDEESCMTSFVMGSVEEESAELPSDPQTMISLPHGAMKGNGRFMDAFRVFQVMLHQKASGTSVPNGTKENVYFLLNNEQNLLRRGKGKMCRYVDDCGTWSVNASCKTHHYVVKGEQLDNVGMKDGLYCKEQKGLKVPLDPQPSDEELITFKRYYVSLKRSPTYRKRISTIAKCPPFLSHLKCLATVEYIGAFHSEGELSEGPLALDRKDISEDQSRWMKCSGSLIAPKKIEGKFLDASSIFQVMLREKPIGQDIPAGIKENVYFLLDNCQNVMRLANGKRSRYRDDCGLWSVNGKSKYLNFAIREGKYLDQVDLKDGLYCSVLDGCCIPIKPQPTDETLIAFRQYYVHLKADPSYRKRVSLITNCPECLANLKNLALIEYLGKWPVSSTDSRATARCPWNPETKDQHEEFVVCSPDIHSFSIDKHDMDGATRPDEIILENGRFLNADGVFRIMLLRHPVGDTVPPGAKENVCFLIDNGENITRKANGKKSRYSDDYGVWSVKPSSDTDHYVIREDGHLAFTSLIDGCYCNISKGEHVPVVPQPTDENVIVFSRYRASLKGDPECRKRISTVLKCPESLVHLKGLAVIEYIRTMAKPQSKDGRGICRENCSRGNDSVVFPESASQHEEHLPLLSSPDIVRNHGKFLDGNTIYRVFLQGNPISEDVLKGRKENLYFICNIDPNLVVETAGKKCPYADDWGPWIAKPSCKTHHYIVTEDEDLDYVDLKDGLYCKDSKGVRIPLKPQPSDGEIITFKRYYAYLKQNPNYKRRVSIILKCALSKDHLRNLAVVEYIGSL